MFTKRKRLILILSGIGILLAVFLWPCNDEPRIGDRTLSQLLALCKNRSRDGDGGAVETARQDVRRIGTNAIPHLLRWIQVEPESASLQLQKLSSAPYLPKAVKDLISKGANNKQPDSAVIGFWVLGTNAATAIPELERLTKDKNNPYSAARALSALALLGKDALPPVLKALRSPAFPDQHTDAMHSIVQMHYLGTNLSPAIPILINYTRVDDPYVSGEAISCLRILCKEPKTVPTILPLLTNSDLLIRAQTSNLLQQLAPELLTNNVTN